MFIRSKKLLVSLAVISSAAVLSPAPVDARGGGGFGGGGFGGGGFRSGGFGGGFRSGFAGGGFRGYSGFRGTAGTRGFSGYNGGSYGGYRGFTQSGTQRFAPASTEAAHVPRAPVSPRMNGRQFNGDEFNRFRRGEFGGYPWGFWLGPNYWGFGFPWWYGGFPFWYDTLAYGAYWDPYYNGDAYDYGGYDYGVPLTQQTTNAQTANDESFAAARADFYAGNYTEALQDIRQAIVQDPTNPDVHEFHALVLFALGDYPQAAAVAHTVLNAGPGWDWSVLQTLYPSVNVYTTQLRALEHYIDSHPDQAATRFLLGYQYAMLGHLNAARRQFQQVVELEPRDTLTKNILAGLWRAPGVRPEVAQATEAPKGSTSPASQPTLSAATIALVGDWTSQPAPNVTVRMNLDNNGRFIWSVTHAGQTQTFSGTYARQGDDLVLTRQDGQKMDGVLSAEGPSEFRFRLKNAGPNDPGLEFAKQATATPSRRPLEG